MGRQRTKARISFTEIANRITGISTPVFGVSWEPPKLEIEVARALITYLEDRQVLYIHYEREEVRYSIQSVLMIRERLTAILEELERSSPLAVAIADLRSACRKFLNKTQKIDVDEIVMDIYMRNSVWNPAQIQFFMALGELRGIFGYHIAQISVRYGIDVEKELAAIFPASHDEIVK